MIQDKPAPNNVDAAERLREAGQGSERPDDPVVAERLSRKAVQDRDSHAYNNLAQFLSELGRPEEVEGLFRQGVAAGDALAGKNLVLYLLEQGQETAARKALKKAKQMGMVPTEEEMGESRAWATTNRSTD
jgi:Tfp pilus assembly protein PilF